MISQEILLRQDPRYLRLALGLARRGLGCTSPNPMVGAILVKAGRVIGRGWHRRAGGPHAEIEAIRDACAHGNSTKGATLYVTLEPCCTHGRTPPCTDAIIDAGIRRVVVGTTDPNPKHSGRAFKLLKRAGIATTLAATEVPRRRGAGGRTGGDRLKAELRALAGECARLNEAFNHWIVHRTPFVTVKAAMTLDGKIGTAAGESKWITGDAARADAMRLRWGADAVLVGINTILADDPSLACRPVSGADPPAEQRLRRIVLDSLARTPPDAKVVSDRRADLTTIVVSRLAPSSRVKALARRAKVVVAPLSGTKSSDGELRLNLRWLLRWLGGQDVTSLLVEGGGEVNAAFLLGGWAHRVAFYYAPKILGGRDSRKAVAGRGIARLGDAIALREIRWRRAGPDLLLTAVVAG